MQQDQIQRQILELQNQLRETRLEIRVQADRLNGLWWKLGLMAGIISVIASEVFGAGIGGVISTLIGALPI